MTGAGDQLLRIWDTRSGELVETLPGHSKRKGLVNGLAVHPDGERLVSCALDQSILVWRRGTATPLKALDGHTRPVKALAFSPDGSRLLSGGLDATARMWDLDTGESQFIARGHDGEVEDVAFHPDGTRFATASSDGTIRIWDALAGEPLLVIEDSGLRNLCCSVFYALPDLGTGRNPNWDAIGFPGPPAPPPVDRERPLRIRKPSAAEEALEVDVCVVGSGAGGGVIAGELAKAGRSVAVLEAGGYHDDADFDGLELSAYQRMYLNGGPLPDRRGPGVDRRRSRRRRRHCDQLDQLPADLRSRARGVGERARPLGPRRVELRRAPRRGLRAAPGERRVQRPERVRTSACARPARSSATTSSPIARNTDPATYDPASGGIYRLRRSIRLEEVDREDLPRRRPGAGAEILAGCRAESVLVEDGRAAGVEARVGGPRGVAGNGAATRLTVSAPIVVVACGSIESPALLLRSAIGGPAVGEFLRLHPTVAVTAYYDEPQNWKWGPPQSGALPRVRGHRRGLRLPDRVGAGDDRPLQRRGSVALGRRPQAPHARVGAARRR